MSPPENETPLPLRDLRVWTAARFATGCLDDRGMLLETRVAGPHEARA